MRRCGTGTVVHRSPVGEINVVKLMQEVGAVIGGEGNGGVILPALHHGRDAVVGIALMLQIMAERSRSLSELVGSFTRYTMLKDKIDIEGMGDWKKPVLAEFDGAGLGYARWYQSESPRIVGSCTGIEYRADNQGNGRGIE